MKSSNSSPRYNLTSFALGEVSTDEMALYDAIIKSDPEAAAEYQRISNTVGVLKQYPPPPTRRLHPQQLQRVLKGAKPSTNHLDERKILPFYAHPVVKYAAAAVCTIGAFVLGHITSSQLQRGKYGNTITTHVPAAPLIKVEEDSIFPPVEATTVHPLSDFQKVTVKSLDPKNSPQLQKYFEYKEQIAAATKVSVEPETPSSVAKPTKVKSENKTELLDIIASIPATSAPISLVGFRDTLKAPESFINVTPKQLRSSTSDKPKEVQLGSMRPSLNKAQEGSGIRKEIAQPPLEIHSWKTELMSCPWDPNRRLLKVVFHLPEDQTALQYQDAGYQFQVQFDPFQILGFRAVADRHMPSPVRGGLASRLVWYEIIPSRNFDASLNKPIKIGELKILPTKGSHQNSVSSPLIPLVDVGTTWKQASPDLVYETAMVALGMLLQGSENTSFLDHSVVLEIAEAYQGKDDQGAKARFIELIRNSTQAGGLNN